MAVLSHVHSQRPPGPTVACDTVTLPHSTIQPQRVASVVLQLMPSWVLTMVPVCPPLVPVVVGDRYGLISTFKTGEGRSATVTPTLSIH